MRSLVSVVIVAPLMASAAPAQESGAGDDAETLCASTTLPGPPRDLPPLAVPRPER